MSGHSKWAKIKHQKGVADVKKGKIFSQLAHQITLAVRQGGSGNPDDNPHLRVVLEKAKEANLPKDNVSRAIDRGLGKGSGGALVDFTVEGYGPGGVAVMATGTTDNPNRSKSGIRSIFDRHGGNIGEPGSVAYIFSGGQATFTIPLSGDDASRVRQLVDALEDDDDIEEVRHNAAFPE